MRDEWFLKKKKLCFLHWKNQCKGASFSGHTVNRYSAAMSKRHCFDIT